MHSPLPEVFHTSTLPFKEFLGWLDNKPYLDKGKRKITYACEYDFAVILTVLALFDRDISLSIGSEDGETSDVFSNSLLRHTHSDELHSAMVAMITAMDYTTKLK